MGMSWTRTLTCMTCAGLCGGLSAILILSCGGGSSTNGYSLGVASSFTITASADVNGTISPTGPVKVDQGTDQSFTITPNVGYTVADLTVDGLSLGPSTSYTFTNVQALHTISATFAIQSFSNLDPFGIAEIYPSVGREWFNAWNSGTQRALTSGMAGTDPGLVIRGNTSVTIYGASGTRAGQMQVTGTNPRIYVRDSSSESIPPADNVLKWNNVEVTFYAMSNKNSGIGYAGLEAVVKTNHCPDTWDATTRGYGGRMLFDGRIDFEKEVSHANGINVQQELTPWSGGLPLNRWIGYKLVARNIDNGAHVSLELYRELSLSNEINPTAPAGGGNWELLGTTTDTGTWSAGYGNATAQCSFDTGRADRSLPLTWANWSVYLRTDDDNNTGLVQYYKWFSVREIAPLP
jgi:hypothetical protein